MKEKLPPKRGCEAPNHNKDCPCLSCVSKSCTDCPLLTKDHFTPKCIAKVYQWTRSRTNQPSNIQWLSEPCHIDKDRDTPKRRDLLVKQIGGQPLPFKLHLQMFGVPLRVIDNP